MRRQTQKSRGVLGSSWHLGLGFSQGDFLWGLSREETGVAPEPSIPGHTLHVTGVACSVVRLSPGVWRKVPTLEAADLGSMQAGTYTGGWSAGKGQAGRELHSSLLPQQVWPEVTEEAGGMFEAYLESHPSCCGLWYKAVPRPHITASRQGMASLLSGPSLPTSLGPASLPSPISPPRLSASLPLHSQVTGLGLCLYLLYVCLFVCLAAIPRSVSDSVLPLHSEISPSGGPGTLWSSED